ncbi:MAG: hypothetical protein ACFE75_05245 [Candidatus Hodarchaeota archaeon]
MIVLILGIIFLIPAGYLWWHYIAYGYMMGGMSPLALIGAFNASHPFFLFFFFIISGEWH